MVNSKEVMAKYLSKSSAIQYSIEKTPFKNTANLLFIRLHVLVVHVEFQMCYPSETVWQAGQQNIHNDEKKRENILRKVATLK